MHPIRASQATLLVKDFVGRYNYTIMYKLLRRLTAKTSFLGMSYREHNEFWINQITGVQFDYCRLAFIFIFVSRQSGTLYCKFEGHLRSAFV